MTKTRLLRQPAGKLNAAILLTVFVQQDNGIGGLQLAQDEFSLRLLLLFFRQVLSVLEFRYGDDVKGHVVVDAPDIVVDAGHEVLVDGFTNLYENSLHLLISKLLSLISYL